MPSSKAGRAKTASRRPWRRTKTPSAAAPTSSKTTASTGRSPATASLSAPTIVGGSAVEHTGARRGAARTQGGQVGDGQECVWSENDESGTGDTVWDTCLGGRTIARVNRWGHGGSGLRCQELLEDREVDWTLLKGVACLGSTLLFRRDRRPLTVSLPSRPAFGSSARMCCLTVRTLPDQDSGCKAIHSEDIRWLHLLNSQRSKRTACR